MMTSQILKFVDFTEIQKSRYLENKALFLVQIKKFINSTSRATLWQKNTFVAKGTFKSRKYNTLMYSLLCRFTYCRLDQLSKIVTDGYGWEKSKR